MEVVASSSWEGIRPKLRVSMGPEPTASRKIKIYVILAVVEDDTDTLLVDEIKYVYRLKTRSR